MIFAVSDIDPTGFVHQPFAGSQPESTVLDRVLQWQSVTLGSTFLVSSHTGLVLHCQTVVRQVSTMLDSRQTGFYTVRQQSDRVLHCQTVVRWVFTVLACSYGSTLLDSPNGFYSVGQQSDRVLQCQTVVRQGSTMLVRNGSTVFVSQTQFYIVCQQSDKVLQCQTIQEGSTVLDNLTLF